MKQIIIFDTTLRDGEQTPGARLNQQEKIDLALQLEKLGVNVIEAGFPVSSPGDFQSVAEISKRIKNCTVCGLTRAIEKDIDVAYDAVKLAVQPRIHTGIGASDIHIQYKFKSTREKILEQAIQAVKHAKKYVYDVEFYAEDAGRADPEFLYILLSAAIKAGATTVNIPDTTGYKMPEEYGELIKGITEHVTGIENAVISAHCHDDLGMAVANSMAAIQNGARQVEGTINGVGERAGNTALEEVIMNLTVRKDFYYGFTTTINTVEITKTSRMVAQFLHMPVQKNKAIVGENAFAHSSGIHQDGILKNKQTYEIMDPALVGLDSNKIIMTARSGRHALKYKLQELGFAVPENQLEAIYQEFLQIADQKKEVTDKDLVSLFEQEQKEFTKQHGINLQSLHVETGTDVLPVARIKLHVDGEEKEHESHGNGPISAAFQAVNAILQRNIILKSFKIDAIEEQKDALGSVQIIVNEGTKDAHGRGVDKDIIIAATKAYIDAINNL